LSSDVNECKPLALGLQHWLGPRCFVPKAWLPAVYDYHGEVDEAVLAQCGAGDVECGEAGGCRLTVSKSVLKAPMV
jgi:hypothetical protein